MKGGGPDESEKSEAFARQISINNVNAGKADERKESLMVSNNNRDQQSEDSNKFEEIPFKSLFLFSKRNVLRKYAIIIASSQTFDLLMLATILANSVILAMYNPVAARALVYNQYNDIIDKAEIYFVAIFGFEMLVKVIAYGFLCEPRCSRSKSDLVENDDDDEDNQTKKRSPTTNGYPPYLLNPWNVFDFVILLIGIVGVAIDFGQASETKGAQINLTFLRAFRCIRPLRALKFIPGIKIVIDALFGSVYQLSYVFCLAGLILGSYAVLGIALFKGKLRQRCLYVDTNLPYEPDMEDNRFCSLIAGYGRQCSDIPSEKPLYCGIVDENPNDGLTSFDNFGFAIVAVFQSITLEGWTDIMYWLTDSFPVFAQLYFVSLVVFGSFFLMNVISAVVAVNYGVQCDLAASLDSLESDDKLIEDIQMNQGATGLISTNKKSDGMNYEGGVIHNIFLSPKETAELRLIYSYEKFHKTQGYRTIERGQYLRLKRKHIRTYRRWVRIVGHSLAANMNRNKQIDNNEPFQEEFFDAEEGDEKMLLDEDENQTTLGIGESISSNQSIPIEATIDGVSYDQDKSIILQQSSFNRTADAETTKNTSASAATSTTENKQALTPKNAKNDNEKSKSCLCISTTGKPLGKNPNAFFLRRWCFQIVSNKWFEALILVAILVNVVLLAVIYFPQDPNVVHSLDVANLVIYVIFAVEMVLKLFGYGIFCYVIDPYNLFDGFIVLVSTVEIIIVSFDATTKISGIVTVFRALRLLRVLRVVRSWKSLNRLVSAMLHTIKAVFPLSIILFVFLYLFTTVGLYFFGGLFVIEPGTPEYDCTPSYFNYPHCPPRSNYDSFLWAFITSFQIVTGENWNEVMYSAVGVNGWGSFVYFLLVIFFGNMVVMNLFLGACIDGFMSGTRINAEEEAKAKAEEEEKNKKDKRDVAVSLSFPSKEEILKMELDDLRTYTNSYVKESLPDDESLTKMRSSKKFDEEEYLRAILMEHAETAGNKEELEEVVKNRKEALKTITNYEDHESSKYSSLYIFGPKNSFRKFIANITLSNAFSNFLIFVIIFGCIELAIYNPFLPPSSIEVLRIINVVVLAIFTLEAMMKIISFGLFMHPGSYVRDPWNLLDGFVLVVGIIELSFGGSSLTNGIRALRALRPLRLLRRYEGLRIVIIALSKTVLPVIQLGAVVLFVYFIFGVFAVHLYGGKFHRCYIDDGTPDYTETRCHQFENYPFINCTNPADVCNPPLWSNPTYDGTGSHYNFDNVFISILTLYEVSSLELWLNVMASATDARDIGLNPIRGSGDFNSLFFVIFIVISKLFLLQLFVALVIDIFSESVDEIKGNQFLTESQSKWVEMHVDASRRNVEWVPLPLNAETDYFYRLRQICRDIVQHRDYEPFIIFIVIINTLILMSDHFPTEPGYQQFFDICEYVFGSIYVLEAIIKMMAYGLLPPTGYFGKRSNWFDFIIIVAVIAGWSVSASGIKSADAILQGIVSLRALRIMRLLAFSRTIFQLTEATVRSLPALMNISILLLLILFIFAVMGVSLYGEMRFTAQYTPNGTYVGLQDQGYSFSFVNDYANFDTFGNALLTLFRMATGEAWNGVMHDMAQFDPSAYAYCTIYVLIVQFCLISLFVAVILGEIETLLEKNAEERANKRMNKKLGREQQNPINRYPNEQLTPSEMVQYFAIAWGEVKMFHNRSLRNKNTTKPGRDKSYSHDASHQPGENGKIEKPLPDSGKKTKGVIAYTHKTEGKRTLFPATRPAAILELGREFDSSKSNLRLPLKYFYALLQRVQAPFGLRGLVKKITSLQVLILFQAIEVDLYQQITHDFHILYHPTLEVLISNYVLKDTIGKWIRGILRTRNVNDVSLVLQEILELRVPDSYVEKTFVASKSFNKSGAIELPGEKKDKDAEPEDPRRYVLSKTFAVGIIIRYIRRYLLRKKNAEPTKRKQNDSTTQYELTST